MTNRNLPIGTRDEFGVRTEQKAQVLTDIQATFKKRGFQKITTPLIEYRDVFAPMDRTAYQPYQMLDEYGDTLVLRPDLTLPIARMMSTTGIEPPVKWYYSGDIFRVQRRLAGDYNQVTQAGMEIIGYAGRKAEWECLSVACTVAEQLGLPAMTLELGQAQFVDALLAALALDDATRTELKATLFAKNLTRYDQLVADLPETPFSDVVRQWPWLFGDAATVLATLTPLAQVPELAVMLTELRATVAFIKAQFPKQRITIDLSVPAPQNYYTGMVFRGYTDETTRFVFSGGRYDRLLASFQNTALPAVGLSFDVDAVVAMLPQPDQPAPTLIYFDDTQWTHAQALQERTANCSLCLADSRKAAAAIAAQTGATLIDLTQEATK